jgi:agmatine deiminase
MIYLSSLFKKRLPILYAQLVDNKLEHTFIKNTKDIWTRDFMPVYINDNNYVLFDYKPSYLVGFSSIRTNAKHCLPKNINVKYSSLIIDGGNIIYNNKYVVLTDVIYFDNNTKTKSEIDEELQQIFYPKKTLIIPSEKGDLFGHSDGMVRFVDENTIIVNNYNNLGYSKTFINKLFYVFISEGLNILQCPYFPEDRITQNGVPSAKGNYVNFLETATTIFLPQFNIKSDEEALLFFNTHFNKKIIPIDCEELAEYGGLLNCVSWSTYF